MFTVVAAALGREVVAVDAVGHNLALLHRCPALPHPALVTGASSWATPPAR